MAVGGTAPGAGSMELRAETYEECHPNVQLSGVVVSCLIFSESDKPLTKMKFRPPT